MVPTTDYLAAAAEAERTDHAVGATIVNGTPVYFLHPHGASDDTMRELSFEARYGRPMSEGELALLELAVKAAPDRFNATLDDLVPA